MYVVRMSENQHAESNDSVIRSPVVGEERLPVVAFSALTLWVAWHDRHLPMITTRVTFQWFCTETSRGQPRGKLDNLYSPFYSINSRSTQPSTLLGTVKWVPAKGLWCSAAGKVTAGLAESNGSLPPGGWLKSSAGWLSIHWDQLRAQRLVTSMGSLYLYSINMLSKLQYKALITFL